MSLRFFSFALFSISLLLSAADCPGQEPLTAKRVNEAIDRAVRNISQRQRRQGNWDELQVEMYRGGSTALATLALLSCDVPPDDPRIRDAIDYLRGLEPRDTYVVGLQTMIFAMASPKRDYRLIERNAEWLVRTRLPGGLWSYGDGRFFGGDASNTQYALLGLNAAAEIGVKIAPRFWDGCRGFWVDTQGENGAWGYPARGSSGSMTVGGISSLVITSRHLAAVRSGVIEGKQVRCKGPREDRPLHAALQWIGRNFSVRLNPNGEPGRLYYYLYGLERAGRLTGQRFLGDHDWYREGARFLVDQQQPDGSWSVEGRHAGNSPAALWDTTFAMLFLAKGRIPILINKLRHGPGEDWNNAPNDVRKLTDFISTKVWNKPLNWQTVDVSAAKVEDLLQAPVLQLSGHEAPDFSEREVKLLRDFVDQGGYIMADANCSVQGFDRGFRDLCRRMFPDPEQQLKPLDAGHGVWSSLFQLQPTWPLEGINVGCRTAIFYSPEDLSCQWEFAENINSLAAIRMGVNIVAYATGPEQLLDKLDERTIYKDAPEDKIKRNFLVLAKIKHNGDWNLAPRAVRNLMASLREVVKVDVVQQQRELSLLDPNLSNYPLCYMHGRTKFLLSDEEQRLLTEYLQGSGVLLADASCASERFDSAFRETMKKLFPDKPLTAIPPDHEIFTDRIGYDLKRVKMNAALGGREGPPILEGIEIDGRYAVIYSKYDLGCALEKQSSHDCKGYMHESALKIATNVVLYSLKQ